MHEGKNEDGTSIGPEEIEDDLTNLLYVKFQHQTPSNPLINSQLRWNRDSSTHHSISYRQCLEERAVPRETPK
jgi:hypothetical protein